MTRRLLFVVGARPNFVKVAPVLAALREHVACRVLHTGQHYDRALSGSFIAQLDFPAPDYHLGVGSGSHAEQTAAVLVGVERVLLGEAFDAVVVAGDVNSTVAAALAAAKLLVPVVHLESGLRSRDWSMPEEVNRVVTDRLSDLLLCHCQEAVDNLRAEGVGSERIALVGNTMIDSLFSLAAGARATEAVARRGLTPRGYVLVTLHRPALVDDAERLGRVIDVLATTAETMPVVFPVHPRTRARLDAEDRPALRRVQLLEPLEYLEFVALQLDARLVVTDSGGVQEETSALGIPCLTYRPNTERMVTVELGTNRLIGMRPGVLREAIEGELSGPMRDGHVPIPLWDGQAGPRAADAVLAMLGRDR